MPVVTVNIQPTVMNWLERQPCIDYLNSKLSSCFTAWRNGTAEPTFNQIKAFSRSTGIPLGYFFLKVPPEEQFPLINYRSIENYEPYEPSRELINTIHNMEEIQDWIRDYKIDNEFENVSIVGSVDMSSATPEKLAKIILSDMDISNEWYRNNKIKDSRTAFSFF